MDVKITLNNRWAIIYGPDEQRALKPYFSYLDPAAKHSPRYRMGVWDGMRSVLKRGKVGAGAFLTLQPTLLTKGFVFDITDCREYPVYRRLAYSPNTRPYQAECVQSMITASNQGGIVLAATGAGKTRMAAEYLRHLTGNACFVVDELTLLDQARKAIGELVGERIGIVGNSEYSPQRITVATIQTLYRRSEDVQFKRWFIGLDVVLIDELHLALNKRNLDVLRHIRPKAVFGLTATLELDKPQIALEATSLCGPVIFRYGIDAAVAQGYLGQGRVIALQIPKPASRLVYLDREAEYNALIVRSAERNACICALVRECVRKQRKVVVLVERLDHLRLLSKALTGVPHAVLSGAYSKDSRKQAVAAMDANNLNVILASRIFSKGIDIRTLNTTIDATGYPSANNSVQRYGRRRIAGIHIDIADTYGRFETSAKSRLQALAALKVPIQRIAWNGDAAEILQAK